MRPSIVVVDDEESVLRVMECALTKACFRVLTASNGEQALDVCRGSDSVDLALIDLGLPGMKAIQLAASLCGFYPGIAILYVSGWDQQRVAELLASDTGLHEPFVSNAPFLAKPFTPKTLIEKVREVLSSRVRVRMRIQRIPTDLTVKAPPR